MSLLRLLRAGKSLVGARESGNRYRLLNGPALPKFGSEKNLFREPTQTAPENAAREEVRQPSKPTTPDLPKIQEVAAQEQPVVRVMERKPVSGRLQKEKQDGRGTAVQIQTDHKPETPAGASSKMNVAGGQSAGLVATGARAAARVLRLNPKLNPLLGWVRPKGGARALPRTDAMVQGELSLDRVKVVRNDLSDSDLEIITASKPAPAPVPPAELAAAESSPASPWGRVASRLFGRT